MSRYRIEAARTPSGSLTVDRPIGLGHDQFIAALTDELEDEMRSDRSLQRVTITIDISTAAPQSGNPA